MKLGLISGSQIRAARAILRWSAQDLASKALIGANTVRRAEASENETSLTAANEAAIRGVLEKAGIEFIFENGGGAGVRLREPSR